MIKIANFLKDNDFKRIAITSDKDDTLEKLCDEKLTIYCNDTISDSSSISHSISIEFLFDVLITKLTIELNRTSN